MFVQTRRRKTENPMRTAAGRPPFLLLLGVVLGVWPLAYANSITVVLESRYCKSNNSTAGTVVCNYTDATDEVILSAYPDGCNKWKTLELVGAKRLNVIASCFNQIIVSSSNELSLAVHPGEETKTPERSLHIRDSNVHSLEGAVGRLYINRSSVASLSVSHVADLDIDDSSVDSFDSVLNQVHDCLLSNTSIKSLDRLEVSGNKDFKMVDCHIEVLKKMVQSVSTTSEIKGGAIHRITKGGIEVKDGQLMLMNVSIGSLEKEATLATGTGNLNFMFCSINEAVVDSVSLRDGGTINLDTTSVMGAQLDFFMQAHAELYPFSLFKRFDGFSTLSMVGSGFLGALVALLVALAVFLILMRRGQGRFSFPCSKTHLISRSSSDDDDTTKDTPQGKPPPFAHHDVRLELPPPPAPPTNEGDFDDGDRLPHFVQRSLPPAPPQPDLPTPVLGTPPKPPPSLPPDFLPKNERKNPFPPATTHKDDLAKETCLLTRRGPFSFKKGKLDPESNTKAKGSFLHDPDRKFQDNYDDTGPQDNYDDAGFRG